MEPTTYTYDSGAQERFNLFRGPQTPKGHAVGKFEYSDGEIVDGYVNIEWLRERLDSLDPIPTDITDTHVVRARLKANEFGWFGRFDAPTEEWRQVISAALTEPDPRAENAQDIEDALIDAIGVGRLSDDELSRVADQLASRGFQFVPDYSQYCGKGPCALEGGHGGPCRM